MIRGISYAACAALCCALWCGCGRQESAAAAAGQAPVRRAEPQRRAGNAAPEPPARTDGRVLAEFIDDRAVFYAVVPDVAALAALLAASPIQTIAKHADFGAAIERLVGAKAWEILGHEMGRAFQGLMRGQAEAAVVIAPDGEGGLRADAYVLWNAREEAERAVRVLADCAAALRENVPELIVGETTLAGVAVRTAAFGRGAAETWYFAPCDGEVRISTDPRFFETLAPAPRPLRAGAAFTRVQAQVQSAGIELAFVYAHFGKLLSALFGPSGREALWRDLGLDAAGAAGIASYRSAGKIRDVWHVEWPEAGQGLAGQFLREANVRGALAVVPADVGFFGVFGVDLRNVWPRAAAGIAKAWPKTWETLARAASELSAPTGADADALLSAFGPEVFAYARAGASPCPDTLVLSVGQREILRDAARGIEERLGRPLLRESVDGYPIYAAPDPLAAYVGLGEQHLIVSRDIDAVRDFLRNRRSRANPLAARSEMREILAHEKLGGMVYVNPHRDHAAALEEGLAALAFDEDLPPALEECLREVGRILPQKLGPLWMVFRATPEGFAGEIRSEWGVAPTALGAGALGALVGLPAFAHARQGRGERKVLAAINAIMVAQEEFRLWHNRYAQNLSELKDGGRIDAETARGVSNGYIFKLKSGGERNWMFDARPMSGRGRFYYCDETGTIRVATGTPAHQESPVLRESP
ncbi:MAG: hypothetical protein BWX69_00069 [Planctomycetes bacterium ADurb.Bin069]|nr:MAG: hypothetical protein BWX69_00069 [Planctomycetes bacterium ADurb.Bin069]